MIHLNFDKYGNQIKIDLDYIELGAIWANSIWFAPMKHISEKRGIKGVHANSV
jgi:hypothetical protein